MKRKTPILLAMCLLFLSFCSGTIFGQSGFDKIHSFSPYPQTSVYSGIFSTYADSQSIFVAGPTIKDTTSVRPYGDCTFVGAFDYSGNLKWQKRLTFPLPSYMSTHPYLFHSIEKVSPDRYVIGAQGWDFNTIPGFVVPRPFLYFFNGSGDSLGFVPIPYNRPKESYVIYALMADRQKNIIVTGKYTNDVLLNDTTALWLSKFDSSGRFLWRKVILNQTNSNGWAEAYKVINSNDGLHYVLGGRASHTNIQKKTWFAVWKTDTAGNVIWQKNIPKATQTVNTQVLGDQYFDIIPAVNGSGYYFLAVDLKPTHPPNQPKSVTTVYYCGKLDEDGKVVWAKTYQRDSQYFEQVYGLAQKPNGDLLFMGQSASYITSDTGGPTLFCTDSLGNLKWLKITKRYHCPYNVNQVTCAISLTPYGGIARGGYIDQFNKQPGCYDTAEAIAWLVLTDSLGRRSLIDTTTYPMTVDPVVFDDTPATITIRNESALQIKIYPNPTRDKVTISLAGLQENPPQVNIQLYDYTGRLLQQQNMKTPTTTLDLSNYAPGIYFIRLRHGDKDIGGGKIVKQ